MTRAYQALSRYPKVTQDLSLKVKDTVSHLEILRVARGVLDDAPLGADCSVRLSTIGIYQPEPGAERTITLRFEVVSHERTLTDALVAPLLDAVTGAATKELGAIRT
jgi:phenylalanyl-tRNA synthetase beta subunit